MLELQHCVSSSKTQQNWNCALSFRSDQSEGFRPAWTHIHTHILSNRSRMLVWDFCLVSLSTSPLARNPLFSPAEIHEHIMDLCVNGNFQAAFHGNLAALVPWDGLPAVRLKLNLCVSACLFLCPVRLVERYLTTVCLTSCCRNPRSPVWSGRPWRESTTSTRATWCT